MKCWYADVFWERGEIFEESKARLFLCGTIKPGTPEHGTLAEHQNTGGTPEHWRNNGMPRNSGTCEEQRNNVTTKQHQEILPIQNDDILGR